MDSSNVTAVATGEAAKISHSKPKARVDDENVQNVDFLDIMNRLTASQQASGSSKASKNSKATSAAKVIGSQSKPEIVGAAKTDEEVLDTLDEIMTEYGAENLNADILMSLMSMYTTDSSVNALLTSDDPMAMVQSSLYTAVLDNNTSLLSSGGEMIDEIGEGYFDDLLGVMGSSKTLNSLLEVLASVKDADELERALKTISGITVSSEINEVDQTVNVLSEQLNLSKAVQSAKESIESGAQQSEAEAVPEEGQQGIKMQGAKQQTDNAQKAGNGQTTAAVKQTQSGEAADIQQSDPAAQAMGFVDYGRGVAPKEVLAEGTPEEKAVFNQTYDLLSRAITEERQLYTARLHPEGLGEVIIRMERSSAGLVFDILATNEKTAQMINARLMQLQNGMSEYEAKINPAVVTSSSNAESASGFGFDDFTGGFNGAQENAYSGNRQRAGSRYAEAGEDELEAKTTGYKTTDILNRTI